MKKESKLKKKHKELKETAKGRAILKLIYWGIFFFILFVFLGIMALITPKGELPAPSIHETEIEKEPTPTPPVESTPIIEDVLSLETKNNIADTLTNKTYDYNYTMTNNNIKYIYKGTKNPIEDIGYKESPTGIIKYVINSEGTFNETTTGRTTLTNLYEETSFDLNNILNELKQVELKRNKECDCINYIYDGELLDKKYQIELENNTNVIKSINVNSASIMYDLEYNIKGGE